MLLDQEDLVEEQQEMDLVQDQEILRLQVQARVIMEAVVLLMVQVEAEGLLPQVAPVVQVQVASVVQGQRHRYQAPL
jgi:hypothetical protein